MEVSERTEAVCCEYRNDTLTITISGDIDHHSAAVLILGRYTTAQELGADFCLQNPTPRIEKILSLAGTDRMIKIERTGKQINTKG